MVTWLTWSNLVLTVDAGETAFGFHLAMLAMPSTLAFWQPIELAHLPLFQPLAL